MLTFEELGIEQWEFDALVQVKKDFENPEKAWMNFSLLMPFFEDETEYGYNYCEAGIAGWVAYKQFPNSDQRDDYVFGYYGNLSRLYYATELSEDFRYKVTKEDAAKAIGNYLETGFANWLSIRPDLYLDWDEKISDAKQTLPESDLD